MKKLLLIAAFLASLHSTSAQVPATANLTASDSGSCTTPNSCLTIAVGGNSASSVIQLAGTFSATAQFEASTTANAAFTAIAGIPLSNPAGTPVTSATAGGAWRFNVASVNLIRVRLSVYTSGTVIASITASNASSSQGGGGSFGPAVSSVTGDGTVECGSVLTGAVVLPLCNTAPQNSILAGPPSGGPGTWTAQTTPTFNAVNLTNVQWPALVAGINANTGTFSFGSGATFSLSAANFIVPAANGFTASSANQYGLDGTHQDAHFWNGVADALVMGLPPALVSGINNGDVAGFTSDPGIALKGLGGTSGGGTKFIKCTPGSLTSGDVWSINGSGVCVEAAPSPGVTNFTPVPNVYTTGAASGALQNVASGQGPGGSNNLNSPYAYAASDRFQIVTRGITSATTDVLAQAGSGYSGSCSNVASATTNIGFACNYETNIINTGTATLTVSTTTSTFTCPIWCNGTNLILPPGFRTTIYSQDNSNWTALVSPYPQTFGMLPGLNKTGTSAVSATPFFTAPSTGTYRLTFYFGCSSGSGSVSATTSWTDGFTGITGTLGSGTVTCPNQVGQATFPAYLASGTSITYAIVDGSAKTYQLNVMVEGPF
jgi:hypothetical protein